MSARKPARMIIEIRPLNGGGVQARIGTAKVALPVRWLNLGDTIIAADSASAALSFLSEAIDAAIQSIRDEP